MDTPAFYINQSFQGLQDMYSVLLVFFSALGSLLQYFHFSNKRVAGKKLEVIHTAWQCFARGDLSEKA